jgi:hypothetical protein
VDPSGSLGGERLVSSPIVPHLVIRDSCQSPPR